MTGWAVAWSLLFGVSLVVFGGLAVVIAIRGGAEIRSMLGAHDKIGQADAVAEDGTALNSQDSTRHR